MSKLVISLIAILTVSCASNGWEKDMKSKGYSDSDTLLIKPYKSKYATLLSEAFAQSNEFNDKQTGARAKVFRVYCNCYKSIGDKCDGLSSKSVANNQKVIWAKHHGAKYALKALSGMFIGNVDDVDRDYCR